MNAEGKRLGTKGGEIIEQESLILSSGAARGKDRKQVEGSTGNEPREMPKDISKVDAVIARLGEVTAEKQETRKQDHHRSGARSS